MKRIVSVFLYLFFLLSFSGCANSSSQETTNDSTTSQKASTEATSEQSSEQTSTVTATEQPSEQTTEKITTSATEATSKETTTESITDSKVLLNRFDDIRHLKFFDSRDSYEENEYNKDDIYTFTFNTYVTLKGNEDFQTQLLENGKNPGLGIRALHEQGITGKGINVAIIDQNLLLDHPEFADNIAAYYDTGCDADPNSGSMHAPAVASLLVGKDIGVAPEAKVWFAGAPSWKGDSEYYAKGLYWIIDENKKLPDNEKIRVVSVSAAPSGAGSEFTENLNMWDEAVLAAQNEGILVLDCRSTVDTGFIYPAYYDPTNPEDVTKCISGFPSDGEPIHIPTNCIGVPTSFRTVAEEYEKGVYSYQYTGQGGLSWGIPYAAGVLALGWQVNPDLSSDEIVQILLNTCATTNNRSKIINPTAFIEAVTNTLS